MPARGECRSRRLAGVVSTDFLSQLEMVTLKSRNVRIPLPMTPTDSRRLNRHALTKPARLDFGLPPATLPRKRSHESSRSEVLKERQPSLSLKARGVLFEKLRSAQDAWKRSPSVSTDLMLSRLTSKREELRHGQCENSVSETKPVRYEMRRYPSEADVPAVFKRISKLPPAFQHELLESPKAALFFFLRSASINRKNRTNIFFTAEKINFLR